MTDACISIQFGYDINNFSFENDPIETIMSAFDRILVDDVSLIQDAFRDKDRQLFGKFYTVTAHYILTDGVREYFPACDNIGCHEYPEDKHTKIKMRIPLEVFAFLKEDIRSRLSCEEDIVKYIKPLIEATLYDNVSIIESNKIKSLDNTYYHEKNLHLEFTLFKRE